MSRVGEGARSSVPAVPDQKPRDQMRSKELFSSLHSEPSLRADGGQRRSCGLAPRAVFISATNILRKERRMRNRRVRQYAAGPLGPVACLGETNPCLARKVP